jgi:hypothetical protein
MNQAPPGPETNFEGALIKAPIACCGEIISDTQAVKDIMNFKENVVNDQVRSFVRIPAIF